MARNNAARDSVVGIFVEIVYFSLFIAFLFGLAVIIQLLIG
jgi:hypothetical protein